MVNKGCGGSEMGKEEENLRGSNMDSIIWRSDRLEWRGVASWFQGEKQGAGFEYVDLYDHSR